MKKKQIVFLFLLILLFLVILNNKVFATAEGEPSQDLINAVIKANNNCNNIVILKSSEDDYFYAPICKTLTSTTANWRVTTRNGVLGIVAPGQVIISFKRFKSTNLSYYFDQEEVELAEIESNYFLQLEWGDRKLTPVYTTNDITYQNVEGRTDSDVFFHLTPKLVVRQAVERVGVQNLEQVQKEILAILPVILSVVVSLLALRKALELLLNFLKIS